jgi:hypothetical protein
MPSTYAPLSPPESIFVVGATPHSGIVSGLPWAFANARTSRTPRVRPHTVDQRVAPSVTFGMPES